MNLDEFLRSQETMSDLGIFDGESYRGVSRKKLLAIVRKLREQREWALTAACDSVNGALRGAEANSVSEANDAALDEIVRGG